MGKSLNRDERKLSKYIQVHEDRKRKELSQYTNTNNEAPRKEKPKVKWRPRSEIDVD